ncbi:MAG: hypothetical protein ACOYW4_01755 [Bacillota bacterium]
MSVKLSHRSGEILGKLQRALRLPERPPLLRLAFAHGLLASDGVLPHQEDSRGPEIPIKVITAGQDLLMDALLVEALGGTLDPTERRKAYKILVDYGLLKLWEQFEQMDGPSDFLVKLARQSVVA